MDITWRENTILCEAYHTSREETAMLKAAVDSLMKILDESTTISTPPSPETATTSTMMKEMIIQLSCGRSNIQDVRDAVCNHPSKRN
jgi:hypothetical protein